MNQGSLTSINWSMPSNFTGYVYDNDIYMYNGEKIGVNLAKYQEVEQALTKCKNRLIELGEIKIPKTQDQIIQEQQDLLEKQSQAIQQLLEKINEPKQNNELLTTGDTGKCTASITESVADSRPDNNKDKRRRTKSIAEPTE